MKGYMLNIPDKLKTKATCRCTDGKCNWVFTKGDIMCVKCAANALQGKDGRAVQVINVSLLLQLLYIFKHYFFIKNGII